MYETGRAGGNTGASSRSDDEAVKWYRKAAESGSAAAELNLGLAYFNGTAIRQDLAEAVKWFRKSAAHGSGAACDQLGRAYQNGAGVARDDHVARNWYQLAISSGYRQAEQDLASLNSVPRHAASHVDTIHVRHPPRPEITF
jgi:TPR repeat protein